MLITAATLLANASLVYAQEGGVIVHGIVKDSATGKPVPGASVYREEMDDVAVTDEAGEFSFPPVPPGRWHLAVVDPSYQRANASSDGASEVDITLVPVSLRGTEIVVETEQEHTSAGEASIPRDEIMKIPGSNGDPLKAIKNLPGVANTQGFGTQAGLVIRGSSPADSRILVDGFEIPLLYHLGGITSVLPGEMIGDLKYSPGGFGVEWGNASGGIVEVTSREGGNQLAGFADVSFINASTMLQGPIGKNGSFAVAVRRSYIDAILGEVAPSSLSFTALPRYYDYQARVDYKLSPHLKLNAFLIGSDDVFGLSSTADNPDDPNTNQFSNTTSFQRVIGAATYDRPGVYNKLSVSVLNRRLGLEVGSAEHLHTQNQSLTVRDEAKVKLVDGVSLVAGGQAEVGTFDVDVKLPRPQAEGDPAQPNFTHDPELDTQASGDTSNLSGWTAAELAPVAAWKTTLGVRVDNFRHNDATVVQPRAQTRLKLSDDDVLLGSFGLYTRPPDNQDENLQADLKPERAWQSSVGIENKLLPGVTLQTT
ncbi:MAG TPA: TonB-dependent receptor, partial [Kofleriaceae bacterium]